MRDMESPLTEFNPEIYLSIVQRKVLTPNDFRSLAQLQERLLAFQTYYERYASPFHAPSPAKICTLCSPNSNGNPWQ